MKNDFKNELKRLANVFLFENDTEKSFILEKIKVLLKENVTNEVDLNFINNLLGRNFRIEINNFCISNGKESQQLMLSIFSLIFSTLSLQE